MTVSTNEDTNIVNLTHFLLKIWDESTGVEYQNQIRNRINLVEVFVEFINFYIPYCCSYIFIVLTWLIRDIRCRAISNCGCICWKQQRKLTITIRFAHYTAGLLRLASLSIVFIENADKKKKLDIKLGLENTPMRPRWHRSG